MRRVGAVPYAQAYYTPNIEEVQRSFVDKKKEWIRDLEQSADKVEQARISMQNNFVAKNNTSSLGMSASAYQKAMQPLRYTPEDRLIIQTLVSGLPSTQMFANYDPRVKLINFCLSSVTSLRFNKEKTLFVCCKILFIIFVLTRSDYHHQTQMQR
jgi:hypothetical protein